MGCHPLRQACRLRSTSSGRVKKWGRGKPLGHGLIVCEHLEQRAAPGPFIAGLLGLSMARQSLVGQVNSSESTYQQARTSNSSSTKGIDLQQATSNYATTDASNSDFNEDASRRAVPGTTELRGVTQR